MSTMTDTIDVSKLLVNGRVGLSFRKFDKRTVCTARPTAPRFACSAQVGLAVEG